MGSVYYLWFICLVSIYSQLINMKAFIILAVAAMGYAAPAADPQLLQSGLPAGPLTPAWGNGVLTPRGVRPINLEGFSEDVTKMDLLILLDMLLPQLLSLPQPFTTLLPQLSTTLSQLSSLLKLRSKRSNQ